ncbi:putative folate-biopterin transporter 2 [Capsicum annuum]|uniref:Folate-biopterin transporter 2 n=1 Tax=Capsicum annuum TaxID=4072 RepID=A0A1U8G4R4_CAPAN|nr:probable folate-biopterin transporter 3 [Capsicum annuum]PHT88511.1 putative folate-biopterin transporter 2 [Capsicum annuum]
MDQEDDFPLEGQFYKFKNQKDRILELIWKPYYWFRMLCYELHWSFVSGVVIIYGINQGMSLGLSKISTQYYMKDEQRLQPSEAQIYAGVIQIPWMVKPLWGLLTDTLPIIGYRRRPYFILAGLLGAFAMLSLSLNHKLQLASALLCLTGASAAQAVADVTIDACVTENSISHPSLASDMQSLCGVSSSVGQLIGYTISGFLVHLIGSKGVFGVLSIPAALVILVGMMLHEPFIHNVAYRQVGQKFLDACKAMWMALKCKNVWRPCLYMYVSLAVSLHIHEGMFYWYTDAKDGPLFSKEIVGTISSVGAVGNLLGVLLYQNAFTNHPFRFVLFWSQLLYGASGLLDLILVSRVKLQFGIPDYVVAVCDAAISHMIGRLRWMPLLVLSSKLCPSGIEGTFFALLMSIDHVGSLTATWAGGLLLHTLNVTRTQFDNLWMAIVIRSFSRILPIGILFLVPNSDPSASILPAEMLKTKKCDDDLDTQKLERAPLVTFVDQHLGDS